MRVTPAIACRKRSSSPRSGGGATRFGGGGGCGREGGGPACFSAVFSALKGTPRFPPPYHEVDIFEIQDKVIESIMGDVEQQEAAAIVSKPVAEEQALVAQVLQGHLNHPEMDRQELRELRKFLRQPLVGASVQQLRNAIQNYSRTNDIQVLLETVRALYQHQGAGFSHESPTEKPVSKTQTRRPQAHLL